MLSVWSCNQLTNWAGIIINTYVLMILLLFLIMAATDIFFLNFLEDVSPFCGTTDATVLDFWWCLLWPEWATLFMLGGSICVIYSLRFTSGATPTNLLAPEPFSSMYLRAGIGGAQKQDLSCHRRMLYRLSYAGSAFCSNEYLRLRLSRSTWNCCHNVTVGHQG